MSNFARLLVWDWNCTTRTAHCAFELEFKQYMSMESLSRINTNLNVFRNYKSSQNCRNKKKKVFNRSSTSLPRYLINTYCIVAPLLFTYRYAPWKNNSVYYVRMKRTSK